MKRLFLLAALAILTIVGGSMNAAAQGGGIVIPPGTQITCVLHCHGMIFIRLSDGSVIEMVANASGDATLESIASDDGSGGGPAGSTLVPTDINVYGSDPTFGDFEFHFDASRPVPPTQVSANQADGEYFPATCDVFANVEGTIAAFPGTFRNVTECHMQSVNLQSFDPHQNETYVFVKDVEFRNSDADDAVSFTIPAGAIVELN